MQIVRRHRRTVYLVRDEADADADAVCVRLYLGRRGVQGWYIGPIEIRRGRIWMPYLRPSASICAASAITHALGAALVADRHVCIIDPLGLLTKV